MTSSSINAAEARARQLEAHLDNTTQTKITAMHLCDFHELPAVEGQPAGCAWNYYTEDKSKRDQLGRESIDAILSL